MALSIARFCVIAGAVSSIWTATSEENASPSNGCSPRRCRSLSRKTLWSRRSEAASTSEAQAKASSKRVPVEAGLTWPSSDQGTVFTPDASNRPTCTFARSPRAATSWRARLIAESSAVLPSSCRADMLADRSIRTATSRVRPSRGVSGRKGLANNNPSRSIAAARIASNSHR